MLRGKRKFERKTDKIKQDVDKGNYCQQHHNCIHPQVSMPVCSRNLIFFIQNKALGQPHFSPLP